MDAELKKGIVLLKTLIFHYHGMDPDEQKILQDFVKKIEGQAEFDWAMQFIAADYMSAFERSREFLVKAFHKHPLKDRVNYMIETWNDNHKKGYVTEMETTGMMNIAKDLEIETEFLKKINEW